jgi:hypothetical protein
MQLSVGATKCILSHFGLPPVDGAPKVPNMVSLLTAQKLIVMALLDDDSQGRSIRDE